MTVHEATSDEQILACWPVMQQLRDHIPDAPSFLAQVRRMMASDGYRLRYLQRRASVVAVAGFRMQEMLLRGRFLYVDDLVTDAAARSKGHGAKLLHDLVRLARSEGCNELVLESGVWRPDAHRFYFRQGMTIQAFNFRLALKDKP